MPARPSLLALAALSAAACAALPPGSWQLLDDLSDEFDGPLNTTKWGPMGGWAGRAPGLFSPANVVVAGGALQLWARGAHRNASWPAGYDNFTTAALASRAHAQGGYVEVRARSGSSCISSSFWFHFNDGRGTWTEIDVYESMGSSGCKPNAAKMTSRRLCSHSHVFSLAGVAPAALPALCNCTLAGQDGMQVCSSGSCVDTPYAFDDGFHTFGLLWGAAQLSVYADGVLANTLPGACHAQPLEIDFDRETMPDWMGLPPVPFGADAPFQIDYVRTYRRTGA
jgi:beta-glucanase (GH16 family)